MSYPIEYDLRTYEPVKINLGDKNNEMLECYTEWLEAQPAYQEAIAEYEAMLLKMFGGAPDESADDDTTT